MDQVDYLVRVCALPDDGEQDDRKRPGDDLNRWEAAPTGSARGL